MNKNLSLIFPMILILGIFTAKTQNNNPDNDYHPLVQGGKVWSVLNAEGHSLPEGYTYSTEIFMFYGDTLVNDKEYKKMYYSTKKDPIFPQDWALHSLMRENEKKIWYKKNMSSDEILLYDFSLEIGDTVPNSWGDYFPPVVVEDISYKIMSNGEERRVFWLSSLIHSSNNEYWIEGIGSILGLIYPLWGEVTGGYYDLLCYYENNELIFQHQTWETCYKNSVGINIYDHQIKIYPNPANNILHIENVDDVDISHIHLVNIQGQIIKQFEPTKTQLDVSDITSGMYFITFVSSKGNITQKVLINSF